MTSSTITASRNNNNSHHTTMMINSNNHLSLPSIFLYDKQKKFQKRDLIEDLKPLLFKNNNKYDYYQLPPIQLATSSPSLSLDNYCTPSPISSIASSPTPLLLEEEEEHQQVQQEIRRKGSIASILNSDPELKQLDEEESKSNYQSHFFENNQSGSLKRGRPKQDQVDVVYPKKQRQYYTMEQSANENTRATKGLRHFSKQVCDKVAEKGITTYNEVADELALDIQNSIGNEKHTYDQKNIRRRVYDALNVLMAMNIITKDKKVIKWLGIPECFQQQQHQATDLQKEEEIKRSLLLKQIAQEESKQNELTKSIDLLREVIHVKLEKHSKIQDLISRNKTRITLDKEEEKISLPFFLLACSSTKEEDLHFDVNYENQTGLVSFEQKRNEKVVYQDLDVLKYLKLNKQQQQYQDRSPSILSLSSLSKDS